MAAPHVGDRFEYARGDNSEPTTAYAWEEPKTISDAWGVPVRVDVLSVLSSNWKGNAMRADFLGGRGVLVATEREGTVYRGSGPHDIDRDYDAWSGVYGIVREGSCALRNPWQGHPLAGLDGAALTCVVDGIANGTLRLAGVDALNGQALWHFRILQDDRELAAVWLAEDDPYPVVLNGCAPSLAEACALPTALRHGLVQIRFTRGGGGPLSAPQPDPADPAPPPRPLVDDAPGDSGFANFSLGEAAAAIRADVSLTQFQAWLSGHPDAYLVGAAWNRAEPSLGGASLPADLAHVETWRLTWIASDQTNWTIQSSKSVGCPVELPGAHCGVANEQSSPLWSDLAYLDARPSAAVDLAWFFAQARAAQTPGSHVASLSYRFTSGHRSGEPPVLWPTVQVATLPDPAATPLGQGFGWVNNGWYDLGSGALRTWSGPEDDAIGSPSGAAPTHLAQQALPPADAPLLVAAERSVLLVGGLGLVVGLLSWSAPRAPALFAALYTRMTRSSALDHPRRAAIHALVRAEPGIATGEIALRLHAGEGATRHHLDVLRRMGILTSLVAGGSVRWFVAGALERSRMAREAVLAGEGAEARALRLIERAPGVHAAQLARELGVSRPAVHLTLRRLGQKGLVREEDQGARRALFPAVEPYGSGSSVSSVP